MHASIAPIRAAISPLSDGDDGRELSDDLHSMLGTIWRRRWGFIAGFLPTAAAAALYLYLATPEYMARATMVLDPRKHVVVSAPDVLQEADPDSAMMDTQVQLIQSRAVLGLAAEDLRARPEPAVLEEAPLKVWLRELKHRLVPVEAEAPSFEQPNGLDQSSELDDAIDALIDRLEVTRVGLTFAIEIGFSSHDPTYAADVANAVAQAYRRYQSELKLQATKEANVWLSEQVAELQKRVEIAESAVAEYRSRAGLLTAKGATLTENQLSNLDGSLNDAQQSFNSSRAMLHGYTAALERDGAAGAAKVFATPGMQQLRQQFVDLTNQQAQLASTLGAQHPQMLELKGRIDAVSAEMNLEANRTIAELSNEVAIAHDRVRGLTEIVGKSRAQLSEENDANVELAQLQANAQSLRALYDDMLTRLQQTTAQESRSQVNAVLASKARPPTDPSRPRLDVVVPMGLIMATACGALFIMLAQLFDRTTTNLRELEKKTRMRVLAMVPQLQRRDLRYDGRRLTVTDYVPVKPLSLFAEAFRNLRVGVSKRRGDDTVVVLVTSGSFAEGKTTSAIAFAQTAAVDGKRVLLIDADLRRRSLTTYLGISATNGLLELLRGEVTLAQVLTKSPDADNLHVIPLSTEHAARPDSFPQEPLQLWLEKLKKSYDLIIIDSAPVLAVAESLALARLANAVVMVARWSTTPLETVAKARESIQRAGGTIAGLLLTRADIKQVMKQTHGRKHYPALVQYYQQ